MVDGTAIYEDISLDLPIATGDLYAPLFEFGEPDGAGIVLTPMCDLAHGKVEWVKLAHAIPFKRYLEQILIPQQFKNLNEFRTETKEQLLKVAQEFVDDPGRRAEPLTFKLLKPLREIMKNVDPKRTSSYYLPGKDVPTQGYLISFSFVLSVRYEKLQGARPILRLKSPWREQLLSRYISYSSRVGTPDYSDQYVCSVIQAFFPELSEEQIRKKLS